MTARTYFRTILVAIKIGVAVLLVVGLFGLGSTAQPVHGMDVQPVFPTQLPPEVSAAADPAINGTLASFTALIPEFLGVYLPLIIR
jgi:hypothetical protein